MADKNGRGCGDGVYIPQRLVETDVVTGTKELIDVCCNETRLLIPIPLIKN
jgi:hypothetical protein